MGLNTRFICVFGKQGLRRDARTRAQCKSYAKGRKHLEEKQLKEEGMLQNAGSNPEPKYHRASKYCFFPQCVALAVLTQHHLSEMMK